MRGIIDFGASSISRQHFETLNEAFSASKRNMRRKLCKIDPNGIPGRIAVVEPRAHRQAGIVSALIGVFFFFFFASYFGSGRLVYGLKRLGIWVLVSAAEPLVQNGPLAGSIAFILWTGVMTDQDST